MLTINQHHILPRKLHRHSVQLPPHVLPPHRLPGHDERPPDVPVLDEPFSVGDSEGLGDLEGCYTGCVWNLLVAGTRRFVQLLVNRIIVMLRLTGMTTSISNPASFNTFFAVSANASPILILLL